VHWVNPDPSGGLQATDCDISRPAVTESGGPLYSTGIPRQTGQKRKATAVGGSEFWGRLCYQGCPGSHGV